MGLPSEPGVLVEKVIPGGAAERAGLRGGTEQAYLGNEAIVLGGDLIVAIDDKQIEDTSDIAAILEKHQPGDQVNVTIYRGRKKLVVRLTLGDARDVNT